MNDASYKRAKQLEDESQWEAAADMWLQLGRKEDAMACLAIARAIRRGDMFRKEVRSVLGEEPKLTSTTIREWQNWHKGLNILYNKHFGNHDEKKD